MFGMRIVLAAVSTVAILALAACSSDEPEVPQVAPSEADASVADSPSESASEEPVGPTDEDLRRFVELVSTDRPDGALQALKMTAKGSSARAVVTVWHARYTASQTAGNDPS